VALAYAFHISPAQVLWLPNTVVNVMAELVNELAARTPST
jgi:hypothetical protein